MWQNGGTFFHFSEFTIKCLLSIKIYEGFSLFRLRVPKHVSFASMTGSLIVTRQLQSLRVLHFLTATGKVGHVLCEQSRYERGKPVQSLLIFFFLKTKRDTNLALISFQSMDKCLVDEHFQGTFYSPNNDEPLILCLVAVKGNKPQASKADILDHSVVSTLLVFSQITHQSSVSSYGGHNCL